MVSKKKRAPNYGESSLEKTCARKRGGEFHRSGSKKGRLKRGKRTKATGQLAGGLIGENVKTQSR